MNYFYIDYMIKERRKQELEVLEQARLLRNYNALQGAQRDPGVTRRVKQLIRRIKRIFNQKQTVVKLELHTKKQSCSLP